jgi:hypothetical protein
MESQVASEPDINFRPKSYFGPQSLPEHLLAQVKGDVIKERLGTLYKEGRYEEIERLLGEHGISNAEIKKLGSIHPMFMGGNYLPDTEQNEVEIARILIESTTFDVTCLFAKFDDGNIHYRVVDEYDGDTLSGPSEMTSKEPLTLGEMTDFFLIAWSLMDVLEMNFDDDLDSALGFFTGKSDFYPEFDRLCRERVIAEFPDASEDDD